MKKLAAAAVTALMALAPLAGPAGAVEADREIQLNDYDNKTLNYTSDPATGTGTGFFLDGTAGTYECTGTIDASCEYILIEATGFSPAEIAAAELAGTNPTDSVSITFDISNYAPIPVTDFDLLMYASDADGTKGPELARSGNNPGDPEGVQTSVSTRASSPTQYVLVEVVHFAAVMSTYDARVRVS